MTDNNPPAYIDRELDVWVRDGIDTYLLGDTGRSFEDLEKSCGPLVPLWADGQKPQPENAYVWTKGDDKAELIKRLVAGARITMEGEDCVMSGPVCIDSEGDPVVWGRGLAFGSALTLFAYRADQITVVPPPEPVLPEWSTYTGEGRAVMLAVTADGTTWWKSNRRWVPRGYSNGVEPITPAELIARGGRLLVDHNGKAVDA